jgi:hypothetical protein
LAGGGGGREYLEQLLPTPFFLPGCGHDIKENVTAPNTRASRTLLFRLRPQMQRYLLDWHYMDTDAYHNLPGGTLNDTFGYRECPLK